jgi:prolyl oligopeptidase
MLRRLPPLLLLSGLCTLAPAQTQATPEEDPYTWLEEVSSPRALDWVRTQNARSAKEFTADPRFEPLRKDLRAVLDSQERLPLVKRMGAHLYNFWQDAAHPRGLWRRTTPADYRQPQPKWELLVDLDALAATERENWVWKGADCLRPDAAGQPWRRCLISLSRGGADATVLREYDLPERRFVADGFALPQEAKHRTGWKDIDTLWVASDFGAGSLTSSGYPRVLKEWRRGTPLAAAPTVFEGQAGDVWVTGSSDRDAGARRDWFERTVAYWNVERHVLRDGKPVRLGLPKDAEASTWADWLLVRTRTPWEAGGKTFPGGALLAIRFEAFMKGERDFDLLYAPTPRSALEKVDSTRSAVLLSELDNVRPRLWELQHDGRQWQRRRVPLPDSGRLGNLSTAFDSDDYLYTLQDFTTPATLLERRVGAAEAQALKAVPAFFDARGLVTRQFEAVSKDGTRIPYFITQRSDAKADGRNPTLLYGYGGFQISQQPSYSGLIGKGWLEGGGVYVLANLRGGGEFGPAWHQAARLENKQRTWDDMAAVAEDLIRRGVTSPKHLGIMGGSQGGLLVTTVMTQRPELFGAVVSQVPLIDMLRYHLLPPGASWMAEYGNPDVPADRAFIQKWSPYQNVKKGVKYPRLLLTTSMRDDRVHPGHARKMAARMLEQGHDVLYDENIEGGHAGAANNEQSALRWARSFTFLWRELAPRPAP